MHSGDYHALNFLLPVLSILYAFFHPSLFVCVNTLPPSVLLSAGNLYHQYTRFILRPRLTSQYINLFDNIDIHS